MPAFSVIIPSYNRPEQTQRAISSVCAQSYRNFELIVVDDGSVPPFITAARAKGFINNCSIAVNRRFSNKPLQQICTTTGSGQRVTILTCPRNRGVAAARNIGAAYATGTWLAFLDSDDIWHPQKLARQIHYAAMHPQLSLMQTAEIWMRGGKRVNPVHRLRKRGGELFQASLGDCLITPSSAAIRRTFFNALGGFNPSLRVCEDYELWLRVTARVPVGFLNETLVTRFQTRRGAASDQLSLTTPLMDLHRIRALRLWLKHGSGTTIQQQQALAMVQRKCRIVLNGARKRKRFLLCARMWYYLKCAQHKTHSLTPALQRTTKLKQS